MIINIIGGNGVMGEIHRKVFEKYGHEVIISGRNSKISIVEAAKKSDLTIISVPIEVTEETIKKVAPFCKAIIDFTSFKEFPVNTMLKYSKKECEVCGLHPLYGSVNSIKGKTIISCKTERTGKICNEIIACLKKEGAEIIEMSPIEHDKKVVSLNQVLRLKVMAAYMETIKESGLSAKEFYEISSPPTRLIIELMARQINEKNDSMYNEMIKNDKFAKENEDLFVEKIENTKINYTELAKELRDYFGNEFLKELQEKVKKKID